MDKSDSKYVVTLTDDYIDVIWHGHISKEMAAACVDEILVVIKKVQSTGKPLLLRAKIEDPPILPNTDALSVALNISQMDIPFQRIVICGKLASPARVLINTMLGSFQRTYTIRYIEGEDEALDWLLKGDAN